MQDIDPEVQQAVNRIQPLELTEGVMQTARREGFRSVSVDLIYGLPRQTRASFARTLEHLLTLEPDRLAIYNYAHLPSLFKTQRQIPAEDLPTAAEKLAILAHAIERLTQAGYVYIGMDHFAKPTDELYLAQGNGTLHRNFMGYTTQAGCELYGFGVSAISGLQRYYAQNWRKLSEYYQAVEDHHLPTMRGYALSEDDLLRRTLINSILCHGELRYEAIRETFGIDVASRFKDALDFLKPMADDGLIIFLETGFYLTPLGRIFSRNIAMPFDAYLKREESPKPLFSKTL